MEQKGPLGSISDDELLRRLGELTRQSCRLESDLVAHIGEVDARRLYARVAASSMFAYCTQILHLSEAQAYLRIAAARAARQYPILLVMLADGRLHVSGIAKLAPHLTRENANEMVRRAIYGSKRQMEELVAELAPRPDAPAVMRLLPRRRLKSRPSQSASADSAGPTGTAPSLQEPSPPAEEPVTPSLLSPSPAEEGAKSSFHLNMDTASTSGPGMGPNPTAAHRRELRPDAVVGLTSPKGPAPEVHPLAPARYKVQFTASAELRDKLERLRALMRSEVPNGDLAAVIEAAVTLKLERLEARRFGATKAPRKVPDAVSSGASSEVASSSGATRSDAPSAAAPNPAAPNPAAPSPAAPSPGVPKVPSSRYISAAVRRTVWARDGSQCRYVDARGRRCSERTRLEFHHRRPFAVGGDHALENIALLCRAHNDYVAERDYGRKTMTAWRSRRSFV